MQGEAVKAAKVSAMQLKVEYSCSVQHYIEFLTLFAEKFQFNSFREEGSIVPPSSADEAIKKEKHPFNLLFLRKQQKMV